MRVIVARHLHRKRAARLNVREQRGKKPRVISDPLQRGVGEDEIITLIGRSEPIFNVSGPPVAVRRSRARGINHRRRTVNARDRRIRPTRRQNFGRIARAAAEVHDPPGMWNSDPIRQIVARTGAQIGELKVLFRIPRCHVVSAYWPAFCNNWSAAAFTSGSLPCAAIRSWAFAPAESPCLPSDTPSS